MPKGGVYELIQQEPDGKTRNMHSRGLGQYEPKIVCGKCNSGWMSDLESSAERVLGPIMRPHLQGQVHVRRTVAQHRIAATWAAKVALLVVPYASQVPRPAPDSHLSHLYRHKRPPRSFAIWLGTFAGGKNISIHSFSSNRVRWYRQNRGPDGGRVGEGIGQLITFYIGHAMFVVLAGQMWRPYTARGPRAVFNGGMPRIWPSPRAAVEWPTATVLDRAAFDRLPHFFPWLP